MFLRGFIAGIFAMVLAIAGVGLFAKAFSQDWLSFTLASHHFQSPTELEERNWGIGIEHTLQDSDWREIAGIYRNSFRRTSVYAGAVYSPLRFSHISVGLMGGIFTGYDREITPVLAPVISWEWRRIGINLMIVPSYKDFQGVAALQFKVLL